MPPKVGRKEEPHHFPFSARNHIKLFPGHLEILHIYNSRIATLASTEVESGCEILFATEYPLGQL